THDGFPSFLTLGSQPDPHDSTRFVATFGQGALGLPDRDLYLNDDDRSKMLRDAYAAHVRAMFDMLPVQPGMEPPEQIARRVMEVETVIARATMDRVAFRDPRRRDNPADMTQLNALAPNINIA